MINMRIIILIFLFVKISFAQDSYELSFKNIEADAIGVKSIKKGCYSKKYNFLWLVTNVGLGSYNGYYYKNINNPKDSANKPLSKNIHDLYEDLDGNLWISYEDTGSFTRYNHKTKIYTHYGSFGKHKNTITTDLIPSNFYEDSENRLWLPTWNGGLLLYNKQTDDFKCYDVNTKFANGGKIICTTVRSILELEKGKYLITFFQEKPRAVPCVLDINKNTLIEFPLKEYSKNLSNAAYDLFERYLTITHNSYYDKENQKIWIGGYSGISVIDLKNKTSQRISPRKFNPEVELNLDNTMNFILSNDSNLWYSSTTNGIIVVNRKNLKSYYHNQPGSCLTCVGDNDILGFTKDNANNVWVFNRSYGISVCAPYTHQIKVKKWENFNVDYYNASDQVIPVSQIIAKSNHLVYFSSLKGISVYDYRKDSILPNISFGNKNDDKNVLLFKFAKNNTIEFGRTTKRSPYNSQFTIYNESTKQLNDIESTHQIFSVNFKNDSIDGSYVFSQSFSNLLKFNYTTQKFDTVFNFPEGKIPLPSNGLKLKNNNLFFYLANGGFMIFNEKTKKIRTYRQKGFDVEFNARMINSTFYTKRNTILIGTEKNLFEFDIEKETFTDHSKIMGLEKYNVFNVFEDRFGIIWFTGPKEIIRYNVKEKKYSVINKKITSTNLFFFKSNNHPITAFDEDYIFLPNKKGLTFFNTATFKLPENKPIISIYELTVNDSLFNIQDSILEFKHYQNNIQFKFITDEIYRPSLGSFSYQLIGLDSKIKELKSNEIDLQNVPAGNYKLKVFYKNTFGVYANEFILDIIILKPFWKTWWFILLCVIGIVFILIVLIKKREKDLLKKQQQLENIVNERTAELVIRSKEIETQKHIIEEKQKETIDSIKYAQRIQNALLASKTLLNKNLKNYFIYFNPKELVSGDFYWASEINNKFYFIVADSTGHGIPGAFMSLLNINFLNEAINEKLIENPSEILDYVRTKLIQGLAEDGSEEGGKDGMDCSLVCIDFTKMEFTYSCANNPLIYISNNTINELEADRMPVGKSPKDTLKFNYNTIKYNSGDILYLFTDGYADQFGGEKGKKLKHKNLRDYLFKIHQNSILEQKELLSNEFNQWKGNLEQIDDVCVVGIKL